LKDEGCVWIANRRAVVARRKTFASNGAHSTRSPCEDRYESRLH
jgi:hypothetical protein